MIRAGHGGDGKGSAALRRAGEVAGVELSSRFGARKGGGKAWRFLEGGEGSLKGGWLWASVGLNPALSLRS